MYKSSSSVTSSCSLEPEEPLKAFFSFPLVAHSIAVPHLLRGIDLYELNPRSTVMKIDPLIDIIFIEIEPASTSGYH
jgi:hypothetical protein